MKNLSAPCDKTGFPPLVLPLWEAVDFLAPLCLSSRPSERGASRSERAEGSPRSDLSENAREKRNRSALIPRLRSRKNASSARDDRREAPPNEKIDSLETGGDGGLAVPLPLPGGRGEVSKRGSLFSELARARDYEILMSAESVPSNADGCVIGARLGGVQSSSPFCPPS